MDLRSVSDDELLQKLSTLLSDSRRVESELIAHIAEVDARRLYAREACSSMFGYCTDVLNLSESEAYLRIAVARASRKHPMLLDLLAEGRLHLSGIAKLCPHLTVDNRDEVLQRAANKSKRQIEELIAELAPKPDVPAQVRKLPTPSRPQPVSQPPAQLRPDAVRPKPVPVAKPTPPAKPVPLAPARYKVQFTASAELENKLERLTALLRATNPDIDLADVIDCAVSEKLERLEAKRFAATARPRKTVEQSDRSGSSRYIPAPVRREVAARDEAQCTFVSDAGRRCPERLNLEYHHDDPFAGGGNHEPDNVRLLCRAHNRLEAERVYGKSFMDRYGRADRAREPAPLYSAKMGGMPSATASRRSPRRRLRQAPPSNSCSSHGTRIAEHFSVVQACTLHNTDGVTGRPR